MKNTLTLIALTVLIAACASKPAAPETAAPTPAPNEALLKQKIAAQPPTESATAIAERGAQTFILAPGLTPEQRRKVMAIYIHVYQEAERIREEIGKSKSLLFQTLATKRYDSNEIELLKAHIVKLDGERLQLMFKALKDVQDVIGMGPDREQMWKHFRDFEYPGRQVSRN